MAKIKISIKDLHKSFGNREILSGVNLDVKEGSSLVILGGSGTGKSVLIKTIMGLIQQDSGKIFIDEKDIDAQSNAEKYKIFQKFGFLFQGGALFDSLTIKDNVTFFAEKIQVLSPRQKEDLAVKKLEDVGLSANVLKLYPSELSGGMQKRASLARTICTNPEVIFFDEPTTGLDPIMANVINELIVKARNDLGATTITITHDMASANVIAEEIALLYKGKIAWLGTKEQMNNSNDPMLHQFINGLTSGPIEV